jgi:hypothetical protein
MARTFSWFGEARNVKEICWQWKIITILKAWGGQKGLHNSNIFERPSL